MRRDRIQATVGPCVSSVFVTVIQLQTVFAAIHSGLST